MIAFKHTRELL